jgi:hypothetical protein
VRIPFVGPSYQARSLNADAQRTLNAFLEYDQASPRAPQVLYGRPGLDLAATFGSGPIRGSMAFQDYGMVVSGNQVYSVIYGGGSSYTVALLGTIGTSSGNVGMAFNGVNVIIVDGVAGWLADLSTLTQITDVDFPNGVTSATAMDGYFIVTGNGTQQFWISAINDGTSWNGLDFASAEGSPDQTMACLADHRELWLFGRHSVEVWADTGNNSFPFERNTNAFIQVGVASQWSVRALDNTVYWLGRDTNGQGIVYKSQGYSPIRISTHAVEHAIQGYSVISDATSYTFQLEGHSFYVLNFPTADTTWVYDVSTNNWYEWAWTDPGTGLDHRWRPNTQAFIGGKNHVGDWQNGKMYRLNLDTLTDNGDAIHRLRATQCQDSPNGYRIFYESIRVDMEVGTGSGTVSLRYSNDGGHTWSGYKTKSVTNGTYGTRVKFGPSGSGRNRVWEISTTSPIKWSIVGAYINDTQEGES